MGYNLRNYKSLRSCRCPVALCAPACSTIVKLDSKVCLKVKENLPLVLTLHDKCCTIPTVMTVLFTSKPLETKVTSIWRHRKTCILTSDPKRKRCRPLLFKHEPVCIRNIVDFPVLICMSGITCCISFYVSPTVSLKLNSFRVVQEYYAAVLNESCVPIHLVVTVIRHLCVIQSMSEVQTLAEFTSEYVVSDPIKTLFTSFRSIKCTIILTRRINCTLFCNL